MTERVSHLRLVARGEFAEAERRIQAALDREPFSVALHLDAVRLHLALHEPEKAALHLGRARELAGPGVRVVSEADGVRFRVAEALDHLAHRDAGSAAEALASTTRDGGGARAEPDVPLDLRLEALVL